jgi:tetratricopeptide (TPR) repeat protein
MADEEKQEKTTITDVVKDFSELAVKILGFVAGAVGLLYGVGFAVVNISLLCYGVYEVALVRARYVSAGVFCLLFFISLVVVSLACLTRVERIGEGRPRMRIALTAIPPCVFCYLLALVVGDRGLHNFRSVLDYFMHNRSARGAFYSVWELGKPLSSHFLIWCLGISFVVLLFVRRDQILRVKDLLSRVDTRAEWMPSGAGGKLAVFMSSFGAWSIVAIPLLIVLLYYYGHSVYATFPAALGGGEPILVQFSVEEESMDVLEKLGIDLEAPGLTEEIALIAQTDTRYIVLDRDPIMERDVAVSFDKSFVRGIRYYSKEHYLSHERVADEYTQDGLAYLERGEWDAAIRRFDYALWRMRDYIPAWLGKGRAQLALQDYDSAIKNYKDALDKIDKEAPGYDESSAALQYGRAQAYALSEQAKEAVGSLRKAVGADETCREKAKTEAAFEAIKLDDSFINLIFQSTENAAIWYGLEGDRQREAGNWEVAVVEYGRAISLTQEFGDEIAEASYHYCRAGVYLALDDSSQALTEYQTAIKLRSENATYHFDLAEAYAAQQKLESALFEYEEARKLKSDHIDAWIGEGDAYLALRRNYEDAVERYTAAIAIDRENSMAYYGRARARALLGKSGEAIQDLRRAITLDFTYVGRAKSEPDFQKIPEEEIQPVLSAARYNRRGNLLKGEGKPKEAIREYQTALELDPTNAAYHANLGDVYRQLKRLEEAEGQYQLAVGYDPENDSYHYRLAVIYYDLAVIYHDQEKFSSAIEEYEAAVAINDREPTYHGGLGDAYRQKDRMKEAAGAYKRAIELDESNASYHAHLAEVYHYLGNREGAATEYSEAIRLNEENPAYHYGLAQVYGAQDNKLQEAIQSYQAAIKRNPEYGDAYCGLGLAYQKSNQPQDAIKALAQCLDMSQDEELRKQASAALAELGEQ